jgi:hypothetical protein
MHYRRGHRCVGTRRRETLLVGSSFLITPVPETGVDIFMRSKAHRVYSVTIVAKPRILIEGRISHDEVPLDARNRFWGTRITKLPSEFKSNRRR